MKNFSIILGIFIFFGLYNINFAQWNIKLSTLQEYNDNPFHSPFPSESFISSFNLGVEKTFNATSVGYYGNYASFSGMSERNYYWHKLGIWNESNNIIYGLNLEQRLNGSDYSFYDYINYSGFLKYKFNINNINFFGGSSLSVTDYSDLDDLDNLLGSVNLTANKSFETKTTLIGGTELKYKRYFNTEFSSLDGIEGNYISNIESDVAYTTQLNFYIKVAQSITPTTGLAIQYLDRTILDGTAKTIRELEFAYGDESKYFDDPISMEGSTTSIQITQILPLEIILKGSYYYNSKTYPSQGSYIELDEFDTELTRSDTQQIINLSAKKNIFFGEQALILGVNYQHILNSSNSFWYDYSSNKISLRIDYNF